MINFSEFCNYVEENILSYMPTNYRNHTVSMRTVKKNNTKKYSIQIIDPDKGSQTIPMLYLDHWYNMYYEGITLEETLKNYANAYLDAYENSSMFEFQSELNNMCSNYADVEKHIIARVHNANLNEEFEQTCPSLKFHDLLITYHICIDFFHEKSIRTMITKEMFSAWNVSLEELHNTAFENMRRLTPAQLWEMNLLAPNLDNFLFRNLLEENTLATSDLIPELPMMLVLSFGGQNAACIADPEILQKCAKVLGGDFYILPSSTEEIILLPKTDKVSVSAICATVKEINCQTDIVPTEKFLSNNIYCYSCEKETVSLISSKKSFF